MMRPRDWGRWPLHPIVALLQRGFVWPKWAPPPSAGDRRSSPNKKPGAVSRPGMITDYQIIYILYKIRVTEVKLKAIAPRADPAPPAPAHTYALREASD